MRDPHKLRAFQLADGLAVEIYKHTAAFPRQEQFGLTSQMRRSAVSVACNIVEGCARRTHLDYLRFLDGAYGSACELQYQISLAHRLGLLKNAAHEELSDAAANTCKTLNALIVALRNRGDSTFRSQKPEA